MTRPLRSSPHYRTFIATTRRSVPVPRIGTLPLAVPAAWGSPSRRPGGCTSPSERPDRYRGDRFTRSAPEPEPSSRRLYAGHRLGSRQVAPRLVPRATTRPLGFDVVDTLSTRHQRFAFVRLLGSHLTHSRCAFSATLTTPALDRRSLRWFETSPCRAIPEGQPPSLAQHHFSSSIFYIDPSLCSCHTVVRIADEVPQCRVRTRPGQRSAGRCWRAGVRSPRPGASPRPSLRPPRHPTPPLAARAAAA